jgi:hypothetical protein
MQYMRSLLAAAILLALASPAYAVEVDGNIDPAEWQGAQHITDFRKVVPLTEAPSSLPTEAWVLSTPEGLAIAFHSSQPASVERTRQRTQRDEGAQVDRVNVMIDFDGDGRTGYDFTVNLTNGIMDEVITNEGQFNRDWDGNWKHAVSENDEGWNVEVLIPWYIAPMRKADGETRTVGLYLDRVIGSTGERVAWPAASYTRPRFLSDFNKVELPAHSQSLLAVTPYVVGVFDNIRHKGDFDGGADIFWKPNGQTQLTATINPDFGQVESDELVVNFSAEETFFSDKRPFFTENQGIFDFGLLIDNSQLVYTRRVGGRSDDPSRGASDIAAALKLNGSLGGVNYGVMAAEEKGDAGRTFSALRVNHDFGKQTWGALATHVDRPFLDREANVLGVDHNWHPTDKLTVVSNVVGSDITVSGAHTRDTAATTVVSYQMNERWSQQFLAMHFGKEFEINDFGYLGRNNLNYLHWQVGRRFDQLPETSAYSSHNWRFRIIGLDNDEGLDLKRQLRISRNSSLRDGGEEFMQLQFDSSGHDDTFTRGHGALRKPGRTTFSWERNRPRKGNWAWESEVFVGGGGLSGNDHVGYTVSFEPTYFFSDALSAFAEVSYEQQPAWLVWRQDNLIASFKEESIFLNAGLNWNVSSRQELRVKLQALGLDARVRQPYRVGPDMRAVAVNEPVDDFSLRQLGFQVRYRYELAPLSDLYVVYGRGGDAFDPMAQGAGHQLDDSFRLHDDEQLLVKLSYRFEL